MTSPDPATNPQPSSPCPPVPIRRRLRGILRLTAVALFILILILWVKSYWKGNGVGHIRYTYTGTTSAERTIWDAEIICGSIVLGHEWATLTTPAQIEYSRVSPQGLYIYSPQPKYAYIRNLTPTSLPNRLGFYILHGIGLGGSAAFTRLVIPGWFILLLAAAPTIWMLLRAMRLRRRMRQGHCLRCGYDLRASQDRCPECGTPIPTRT